MSWLLTLVPGEVWAAVGGALAALVAILVQGHRKKREGREEALDEIQEADHAEANRIRRQLAERDRRGSALERLRRLGKLRD
jgi:hypothetical protein